MTFTAPQTITEAFATNGDKVIPPATASLVVANQDTGYPVIQQTGIGVGGLPVSREQTNGVFNLYSQHILWNQVGGQYTFDSEIAAVGGYNLDAVLWCASNKTYQRSLINNNVADFVTNPAYINDGIYWATASGQTTQTITTLAATVITGSSMLLNADLVSFGMEGKISAGFDYRLVGSSTWLQTAFTSYTEYQTYSVALGGLSSNTSYEFRAVAISLTNPNDIAYGAVLSATTTPVITPEAIINITGTSSSPTNDALNTTNIPTVTNGAVNNSTGLMTATSDNCVSASREYAQDVGDPDWNSQVPLFQFNPLKLAIDAATTNATIVLTSLISGLLTNNSHLWCDDTGTMKDVTAATVVENSFPYNNTSAAWSSFPLGSNAAGSYNSDIVSNGTIMLSTRQSAVGGVYFTSTDNGLTWVNRTLPNTTNQIVRILCGNGVFVAVARIDGSFSRVSTSTDGITWNTQIVATPSLDGRVAFSFGAGIFVISSSSTRDILTSTDGTAWTTRTNALPYEILGLLYYLGNKFLLFDGAGGSGFYSTNGLTWTVFTISGYSGNTQAAAYINGVYLIVGNAFNAISADGIIWTSYSSAGDVSYSLAAGNDIFLKISQSTNQYKYSTNGTTWTVLENNQTGAFNCGLGFYGNYFYNFTTTGTGYRSAKGIITYYKYTCTGLSPALTNAPTWVAKGGQAFASSITSVSGTTNYVTNTLDTVTRSGDTLIATMQSYVATGRYVRLRVTCNNYDIVSRYNTSLFL